MNKDFPRWDERSPAQSLITSEADEKQALLSLTYDKDSRSLIILADVDGIICDEYSFSLETNDRGLILDPEIVRDDSSASLIVATQRLANHMGLPVLWESGLIKPHVPIITENGAALNVCDPDQTTTHSDLVFRGTLRRLERWAENNLPNLSDISSGQKLVVKRGRTMLIARFQNEQGERDERVNKNRAFLKLLGWLGLSRSEIFVIAVGNAANDLSIIERADLSIGVSEDVHQSVDVKTPRGVQSAKVLLSLGSKTPSAEIQPADKRLEVLRNRVDEIDIKTKELYVERFNATRKIGLLKAELSMDPVDKKREEDQREANRKFSKKHGISFILLEKIRKLMIDEVVKEHKRISGKEEEGKK